MHDVIDVEQGEWDAIVIGTGIGGGTLGFKLAEAGKRVLFIEKGESHLGSEAALKGQYAEMFFPHVERPEPKHKDILRKAGRWTEVIVDASKRKASLQIPFVGSGTGGSSAIYGMVMERFSPADFCKGWPISYADLKPYYEKAERLYRVRGSPDPLRKEVIESYLEPPALSEPNKEVYNFLSVKGFHPYQVPLACEFEPGCQNCQGFLCPNTCRNDSATICVAPAINQYGACLLEACEAIKFETNGSAIVSVVCVRQERTIRLRSKLFVLAAGALQSPVLLFRSASEKHPDGLANRSGVVGRYLMRHYIDLYAVATKHKPQSDDYLKQIAFNDLYCSTDGRMGTVQSFGRLPPPSIQVATVSRKLRDGPLPILASVFDLFRPVVELMVSLVFMRRLILTSVMEDTPNAENRITVSHKGEVEMIYRIDSSEEQRIESFRHKIKTALRPYSYILIKQADSNGRIAHVCGTCRCGDDPDRSVVNSMNRAHDVPNLFIVDSSVFPTSGGTNPALTIAANALRVAEHILDTWATTVDE